MVFNHRIQCNRQCFHLFTFKQNFVSLLREFFEANFAIYLSLSLIREKQRAR